VNLFRLRTSVRQVRAVIGIGVLALWMPQGLPVPSAQALPCHGVAPAAGGVTTEALRADADVLRQLGGPRKTNFVPPGEQLRFGRAEILVDAPLDDVLRQVRSYANYKDLAPNKFKQSRVVDRDGDTTDVYMQVPLLGGLIVLWQVMRFGPPIQQDLMTTVVDGRYVRGNIKTARVTFKARRFERNITLLECDLLIALDFPAPQENVDEELRDAAGDALVGVRDKAQNQFRARMNAAQLPVPATAPTIVTATAAAANSANVGIAPLRPAIK
jgi:hypothetical protein